VIGIYRFASEIRRTAIPYRGIEQCYVSSLAVIDLIKLSKIVYAFVFTHSNPSPLDLIRVYHGGINGIYFFLPFSREGKGKVRSGVAVNPRISGLVTTH